MLEVDLDRRWSDVRPPLPYSQRDCNAERESASHPDSYPCRGQLTLLNPGRGIYPASVPPLRPPDPPAGAHRLASTCIGLQTINQQVRTPINGGLHGSSSATMGATLQVVALEMEFESPHVTNLGS
jgi:hypothetical protein